MRNSQSTMSRAALLCLVLSATPALPAGDAAPAASIMQGPTYTNPILYADYSDPDVIAARGAYYMVASSFHFSPGIPVLKSRDLVHWTIVAHVLPKLPFGPLYDMPGPHSLTDKTSRPIGGTKYASGVWAPAIRQHGGKYYVYFPTPDEGIFMSTATVPEGPWSAPVQVIAGPGYEDPCPLWDDDGSAWLIHGKVGAGPLILHRMSADGTRVLDAGVVVAEDKERFPVLEGPKLLKREGWYYIFAPTGGVGTGPEMVGRSRSITGPYEWRAMLSPGNGLAGPHQGAYVDESAQRGWFVHFQQTGAFGRIVYLQPVTWKDGWPVAGFEGRPVSGWNIPNWGYSQPAKLQDSDAFDSPRLGLQWSWNHNPDDSKWSLTERPGWLRLKALPAEHLVTARNILTQILQGPGSTIEARIDLSHMGEGQRAGLALFGVRPSWIGAVRENGATHVTLSNAGDETMGPALTGDMIELRAIVTPDQKVGYAWRGDPQGEWQAMGDAIPLAQFSWWKGSRPALFTYTSGTPGGFIDVDWVHVSVKR
jgi:beta-xylosidase